MIGSLLSMRSSWLLTETFTLGDNGVFRPLLAAAGLANTEVITDALAQCRVDARPGSFILVGQQPHNAYRFLPWRPGGVTYLAMGAGVQLVLTGPLSACTIWAFQSGEPPFWFTLMPMALSRGAT